MAGFIIAGTCSGTGKTLITLALMAYFSDLGLKVQGFKAGPDFIDPGHHREITSIPSHNLDSWMLKPWYNKNLFQHYSRKADISIVEGVMGLYDGFSPVEEIGSTAHLAKVLNLPVILVVDASSTARSIVPVIKGFKDFDPDVNIAGVILNRVGSSSHITILKKAISHYTDIKCFAFFKKNPSLSLPSRHLGLYTAEDGLWNEEKKKILALWARESITEGFKKFYKKIISPSLKSIFLSFPLFPSSRPKIAVAYDRAFCFYYEENLNLLKKAGAKIVKFSPLEDTSLPTNISTIYLGGGYPELYAPQLSKNLKIKRQIKDFAEKGGVIYAECGGFMYLMKSISDTSGKSYDMVGIFPFHAKMKDRLSSLGYREVVFTEDTPIGPKGMVVRGHEFHYSTAKGIEEYPIQIYSATLRTGKKAKTYGVRYKNTIGSYVHLHFGSNILCAKYLVHHARIGNEKNEFEQGLF